MALTSRSEQVVPGAPLPKEPAQTSGRWSDLSRIGAIVRAENQHARRWSSNPWTQHLLRDGKAWLELTVANVEAAWQAQNRNISPDLFFSYSVLTHRWVSHHRALTTLMSDGRYGETTAVSRMLFEVTDVINFLSIQPDEASAWRQHFGKAPDNEYLNFKGRDYDFSSTRVRRAVEEAGFPRLTPNTVKHMNSAVHPSVWGAYSYGTRFPQTEGEYGLSFTPVFDFIIAFQNGLLINDTLPHPTLAFLRMCKSAGAPKSLWRRLSSRSETLLESWHETRDIGQRLVTSHGEMEERLRNGEPWVEIQRDFGQRLGISEGPADIPETR